MINLFPKNKNIVSDERYDMETSLKIAEEFAESFRVAKRDKINNLLFIYNTEQGLQQIVYDVEHKTLEAPLPKVGKYSDTDCTIFVIEENKNKQIKCAWEYDRPISLILPFVR